MHITQQHEARIFHPPSVSLQCSSCMWWLSHQCRCSGPKYILPQSAGSSYLPAIALVKIGSYRASFRASPMLGSRHTDTAEAEDMYPVAWRHPKRVSGVLPVTPVVSEVGHRSKPHGETKFKGRPSSLPFLVMSILDHYSLDLFAA